jgi:hypothetical protein
MKSGCVIINERKSGKEVHKLQEMIYNLDFE